ncbi:uncharacterized protein LOC114332024 [Diabrotica virgifera virgifera]|uniref:Uncharacterized protein LOC114332024 n=1 Tax=Diabrotica virgifera virgifera TaxID=50390 RepID=A0A6P7FY97_DIAVI|nr:uncharacterized protein LOC114332024 [Diabrotica virgifera virgifera]
MMLLKRCCVVLIILSSTIDESQSIIASRSLRSGFRRTSLGTHISSLGSRSRSRLSGSSFVVSGSRGSLFRSSGSRGSPFRSGSPGSSSSGSFNSSFGSHETSFASGSSSQDSSSSLGSSGTYRWSITAKPVTSRPVHRFDPVTSRFQTVTNRTQPASSRFHTAAPVKPVTSRPASRFDPVTSRFQPVNNRTQPASSRFHTATPTKPVTSRPVPRFDPVTSRFQPVTNRIQPALSRFHTAPPLEGTYSRHLVLNPNFNAAPSKDIISPGVRNATTKQPAFNSSFTTSPQLNAPNKPQNNLFFTSSSNQGNSQFSFPTSRPAFYNSYPDFNNFARPNSGSPFNTQQDHGFTFNTFGSDTSGPGFDSSIVVNNQRSVFPNYGSAFNTQNFGSSLKSFETAASRPRFNSDTRFDDQSLVQTPLGNGNLGRPVQTGPPGNSSNSSNNCKCNTYLMKYFLVSNFLVFACRIKRYL